jgi:hypothetical protein
MEKELPVRIACYTNLDELVPLAADWDRLARGVPFRSWAWLSGWWRHYGVPLRIASGRGGLCVLVVFDGLDTPVGIAPWYWRQSAARGRVVRFLGLGDVCSDYLSVLCQPTLEEPVAAAATLGRGRAYALAATLPLSNAGLSRADNWKLVLHFLAAVPRGSTVVFDEYHHGLTEHGTLGARLLREPWGWAILYVAALLFAFVALRGRRFGRALPSFQNGPRRSREEYVSTLAALLRQGGHRAWLCEQYAGQVKRALGTHFRVQADLPAREFVAALAAQRPEAAALASPLSRMEGKEAGDDAAVVALMHEVDAIGDRLVGIVAPTGAKARR